MNSFQKLDYIYQHFQDNKKIYKSDPDLARYENNNTLYPYIKNDIEYGLFEDVISSYYLDSQIKDDFKCDQECYTGTQEKQQDQPLTPCTHAYDHITQHINNLEDPIQQNTLYTQEEVASLFTTDTTLPYCGIIPYCGSPTYHYLQMSISVSPQIWQQFVDLVFQDDLIKCQKNFDVIMDDTFIHSTADEPMDDLMDLFKALQKYGLKISPHKCQFFNKKIVYMGLEFQLEFDKVCYTPLKDKCKAIQNLDSPKTLKQTRVFCGMVNFLSSFLPDLR